MEYVCGNTKSTSEYEVHYEQVNQSVIKIGRFFNLIPEQHFVGLKK